MHTHTYTRTNTSLTTRMYSARRVGALKMPGCYYLDDTSSQLLGAGGDGVARLLCAKFVHFFKDSDTFVRFGCTD